MKSYKKNQPNWKNDEILLELKRFSKIFKNRPIETNKDGMRFEHMFATYFILKKIKPSVVIESGVFKGQSTWLIEKTLPKAKIISIDINLDQRKYISKKAKYSNLDFKYHDFSKLPENTLVFFDDHVNHLERIQQAKFYNIKNIILEDNYKPYEGDFYTVNHALNNSGFSHKIKKLSLAKTFFIFLKEFLKKFIFNKDFYFFDILKYRIRDVKPYNNDRNNLLKIIDVYFQFPSIRNKVSRNMNIPFEELREKHYNYITYIKLL